MNDGDALIAVFFIGSMLSGVLVIFMALKQRSESLDRAHRERMAMIERGLVPPATPDRRGPPTMAMSFGIIVVGLGLGLMTLISIAADSPEIGVGVGGSIVIVGAAFIVRSLVVRHPEPSNRELPPPPAPPRISQEP